MSIAAVDQNQNTLRRRLGGPEPTTIKCGRTSPRKPHKGVM